MVQNKKRVRREPLPSSPFQPSPSDEIEDTHFLEKDQLAVWRQSFGLNPLNLVARNAIVNAGLYFVSNDAEVASTVSHTFLNTLKHPNLKATDQGRSGRCWIFAGLNTFRHPVVRALDLNNFEFSETYLYFWDRMERANYLLHWFAQRLEEPSNSRVSQHMLEHYYGDGGYWPMFVNLVRKYGVIPKEAMPETAHSGDSEEMNQSVIEEVVETVASLRRGEVNDPETFLCESLERIYHTLVKFLGQPPQTFTWFFTTCEHEPQAIESTPQDFYQMTIPIPLEEFVVLTHVPHPQLREYQRYQIRWTSNMVGQPNATFVTAPISELKRAVQKSIQKGFPVWFAGDVRQGFDPFHSALDPKLCNTSLVFGKEEKMTKGERLLFRTSGATHAMVIVGFNLDAQGNPMSWQVENSWGYYDHETPGMDGFLSMSDRWFDEYLYMIAVHPSFLSRRVTKVTHTPPFEVDPWDSIAPALVVQPSDRLRQRLCR